MARRRRGYSFRPSRSSALRRLPGSRKRRKSDSAPVIFLAGLVILVIFIHILKKDPGPILVILGAVVAFLVVQWRARSVRTQKKKQILLAMGANDPMQLSPEQYERFCGLLLEKSGWSIQYTKATGDQGADIIAERNGKKMVVQCKQWTKSVGTKAVQEAHAARAFYSAHSAAVVSTASYTSGATDLARMTGVSLLSHNQLEIP